MDNIDGRFTLGSILVAFGLSYILISFTSVQSLFWTFLGMFFIFEGVYFTVKKISMKKKDVSGYLFILFIGISILLFTSNLVRYSFLMFTVSFLISVGLALIIAGGIFKFSIKEIVTGIICIAVGFVLLMPNILNISNTLYKAIQIYGFGGLLILLGVMIMLPRKGGRK